VNGFAGGHENRLGGFVEFARSDAHTWVEIHFERSGWVRFDPTPPDLRLAGAEALRAGGGLAELASALELWWFRNVVDFDRGHQARALRALWQRWSAWRSALEPAPRARPDVPAPPGEPEAHRWRGVLLFLALAAAGAAALHRLVRRRGRGRGAPPAFYAEALRLLARRGLARAPATTARGFADEAGAHLPPRAAAAFAALTEAYLEERFGAATPHRARARAQLAALRQGLRRHRQVDAGVGPDARARPPRAL
jgi:hypothetical protein